jgi:hypothetical protein
MVPGGVDLSDAEDRGMVPGGDDLLDAEDIEAWFQGEHE